MPASPATSLPPYLPRFHGTIGVPPVPDASAGKGSAIASAKENSPRGI